MSDIAERLNGEIFMAELKDWLPTASPEDLDGLIAVIATTSLPEKVRQKLTKAVADLAKGLRESGSTSYNEYQSMKN